MHCKYCGARPRLVKSQGTLNWYQCDQCGETFWVEQEEDEEEVEEVDEEEEPEGT